MEVDQRNYLFAPGLSSVWVDTLITAGLKPLRRRPLKSEQRESATYACLRVWGLEFGICIFEFQASGFEFRVSGLGFRVSFKERFLGVQGL